LLRNLLGISPPLLTDARSHLPILPAPYRAACIIGADLELNWAWQWAKNSSDPARGAEIFSTRTRQNLPGILDLSDRHNIPITWATVGHLFLESCTREDGPAHPGLPRLSNFENEFWRFSSSDWFENDPACWWEQAKGWYAPDLVRAILGRITKHEIACHTFSHIDCRRGVCPPEVLQSEIEECRRAAAPYGVELTSFVHPAHMIGNLETLRACGFTSYRADRDVLGGATDHGGIWELPTSAEVVLYEGLPVAAQRLRYTRIVQRAIRARRLCYLWFHPSSDGEFVEKILEPLFAFLAHKRAEDSLWVGTTRDYVAFVSALGAAS
jgi:hypothetical protein